MLLTLSYFATQTVDSLQFELRLILLELFPVSKLWLLGPILLRTPSILSDSVGNLSFYLYWPWFFICFKKLNLPVSDHHIKKDNYDYFHYPCGINVIIRKIDYNALLPISPPRPTALVLIPKRDIAKSSTPCAIWSHPPNLVDCLMRSSINGDKMTLCERCLNQES